MALTPLYNHPPIANSQYSLQNAIYQNFNPDLVFNRPPSPQIVEHNPQGIEEHRAHAIKGSFTQKKTVLDSIISVSLKKSFANNFRNYKLNPTGSHGSSHKLRLNQRSH
jgi:hypothetical protein